MTELVISDKELPRLLRVQVNQLLLQNLHKIKRRKEFVDWLSNKVLDQSSINKEEQHTIMEEDKHMSITVIEKYLQDKLEMEVECNEQTFKKYISSEDPESRISIRKMTENEKLEQANANNKENKS